MQSERQEEVQWFHPFSLSLSLFGRAFFERRLVIERGRPPSDRDRFDSHSEPVESGKKRAIAASSFRRVIPLQEPRPFVQRAEI